MTATPSAPRDSEMELKDLEVQRKQNELALQLQDLDAKKQDLVAKKDEARRQSRWWTALNTPLTLAVLAALVGYIGSVITWSLTQVAEKIPASRDLDPRKSEAIGDQNSRQKKLRGSLILDAMKTGEGPAKARLELQ